MSTITCRRSSRRLGLAPAGARREHPAAGAARIGGHRLRLRIRECDSPAWPAHGRACAAGRSRRRGLPDRYAQSEVELDFQRSPPSNRASPASRLPTALPSRAARRIRRRLRVHRLSAGSGGESGHAGQPTPVSEEPDALGWATMPAALQPLCRKRRVGDAQIAWRDALVLRPGRPADRIHRAAAAAHAEATSLDGLLRALQDPELQRSLALTFAGAATATAIGLLTGVRWRTSWRAAGSPGKGGSRRW